MGVVLPLRCEEAPDVLERLGEPVAGPEVAADPLRQGLRRRGPQVPPVQQHDARVVAPEAAEHTHVGQGLDMQKWRSFKGSFEHIFLQYLANVRNSVIGCKPNAELTDILTIRK